MVLVINECPNRLGGCYIRRKKKEEGRGKNAYTASFLAILILRLIR
ncbi:hypothetical protein [Phormidium nigroviride]